MSIQHANVGIIKNNLQLYYNREFLKSFRGEATTNIAYSTNNYLNSNGNWWTNSGATIFNDNDTSITKPVILNVDTTNLRIFSSTVTVAGGNQQLGSSIISISPSTQYSMSIYYWFSGTSMQSQPYLRTSVNNNSLGNFAYNGDTNYLNWPRNTWIRLSVTFTTQSNETGVYMSSYTGDNVGEKLAYFGYQLEQKSYSTPLVLGSRSANTVAGGGGLLDISGNNVNADLTNVSFDSTGFYLAGSASANRIQFTTPTSFIYSAAGKTVLMWIKYTSSSYTGFCGLGNAANGQSFNLRSANTRLGFMGYNADYDPGVGPILNNDVWHLIGATFDAYGTGTLKLYVDGVNIASTTLTLNTAPEASNIGYIGRSSHGGGNEGYFGGQVGQFMMYNRPLSAGEILQIFNSQRKTYGV